MSSEFLEGEWAIKASLVVEGFVQPPQEVSTLLGVEPSRTWRAGDPRRLTKGNYDSNGWQIDSICSERLELEAHIRSITDRLGDVGNLRSVLGDDVDVGRDALLAYWTRAKRPHPLYSEETP